MAQLIIARALLIGAGAAATYFATRKFKKNKDECVLCGVVHKSTDPILSATKLRCGHKFHESCLRAYVHSLRHAVSTRVTPPVCASSTASLSCYSTPTSFVQSKTTNNATCMLWCTMRCPVKNCTQKNVMGNAERRHFELWVPNNLFFCQICLKIVERNVIQSLPCSHCFCKKCLFPYIASMELLNPPAMCPMEECTTPIPELVIELVITQTVD